MKLSKNMTPEQRVEVLLQNSKEIKDGSGAYGLDGEILLNASIAFVKTREFEFDFIADVYEVMEVVAENIEANENEDFYLEKGNNESAKAQEYFAEQTAKQMNVYSRKFN